MAVSETVLTVGVFGGIFWLLIAAEVAGHAKTHGQSAGKWFVVGLLFGPLAAGAYWFTRDSKPFALDDAPAESRTHSRSDAPEQHDVPSQSQSTTGQSPSTTTQSPSTTDQPPSTTDQPPSTTDPSPSTSSQSPTPAETGPTCWNCRVAVEESDDYCGNCGARLADDR